VPATRPSQRGGHAPGQLDGRCMHGQSRQPSAARTLVHALRHTLLLADGAGGEGLYGGVGILVSALDLSSKRVFEGAGMFVGEQISE
jgi:hypothetical protein